VYFETVVKLYLYILFLYCSFPGQTFQPNAEAFLPRFSIDPMHMAMSVVNEHEAIYRTALLTNNGPTPILFSANKDSSG